MKRTTLIVLLWVAVTHLHAQPFVFVFLNKKVSPVELPKDQLDKLMDGHMANIKRLASENKLVAAGPFEGGGGIFIFRSSSKKQVQEWLEADPAVHAKRWDVEMFNYLPRIGSVCAVAEPIEMIQYHFMRYEVNITKYTISRMSEGEKEHEQYIKQLALNGDVVTEGTFAPDEGSILVMKGDLKKELIELDPAVQKEFFFLSFKDLYIAKGAFCDR